MFISTHPVEQPVLRQINKYVDDEINQFSQLLPDPREVNKVIAVAGTPTTLAMIEQQIEFCEEKIHGFEFSVDKLEAWVQKLAAMTIEERIGLAGMPSKRADVIVAGASVLLTVCKYLGVNKLTVSTKGVRYGLALMADSHSFN